MADSKQGRAAGAPAMTDEELQDLVASTDTGARHPAGAVGYLVAGVALAWSLFQLYIASPLPFMLSTATGLSLTLNAAESRSIHLAFALFLAYTAYPAFRSSPRDRIPIVDWVLALAAAACALYIFWFYR